MTNNTKKVYLIYNCDDMHYEPTHVIATFLDKDKAEEYLKKLKEEDEKNYQLNEKYSELYKQYYEYGRYNETQNSQYTQRTQAFSDN